MLHMEAIWSGNVEKKAENQGIIREYYRFVKHCGHPVCASQCMI